MFLHRLVSILPLFGRITAVQGLFGVLVPTLSTSAGPDLPRASISLAGTLHPPEPIPKAVLWKQIGCTEGGKKSTTLAMLFHFQLHSAPAFSDGLLTFPSLSEHFQFDKRGRTGFLKNEETSSLGIPVNLPRGTLTDLSNGSCLPLLLISSLRQPRCPSPLGLSFLFCRN